MKYEVLNLYACLGGNRYKWGSNVKVTAVENDPELARMYKERFPFDEVIIGDAHEYLKSNFFKYDIIWSSPPCPSHSRARFWFSKKRYDVVNPVYPDLKLYEEILFLDNYFSGYYIVENVIPFYKPLIKAKKIGRHLFWSNFNLDKNIKMRPHKMKQEDEINKLMDFHEIDLTDYKGEQDKRKIARNLVDYVTGKSILDVCIKNIESKNEKQGLIW